MLPPGVLFSGSVALKRVKALEASSLPMGDGSCGRLQVVESLSSNCMVCLWLAASFALKAVKPSRIRAVSCTAVDFLEEPRLCKPEFLEELRLRT